MMSQDKTTIPTIKIQTRREGKQLILECHQDDFYQGKVDQNPYLNFDIVEEVIKENQFKLMTKNKNQIRIQVYTAVLELNSKEALLRQKLEQDLNEVKEKNLQYQDELSTLRSRLQSFEQQRLNGYENTLSTLRNRVQTLEQQRQNRPVPVWQEQDLNSTANFDVNCIYKLSFNSGYSLTSTSVGPGILYFMHGGTNYSTSNSNRRANTTNWVVSRMLKLRFQ